MHANLLLPFLIATPQAAGGDAAPPGLVLIEGGRTLVGSKIEDVEEWVKARREQVNALAGETPQVSVEVDDFYLMPTEVTNEQYAHFVEESGVQPPWYWSDPEVREAARIAHVEEEGLKAREASAQGVPYDRKLWDPGAWWEKIWRDQPWSVPQDELSSPVTHVSYEEAEQYARWAGLRLMTEPEFHRAARGDTSNIYVWGDEFDPQACNSEQYRQANEPTPVGTFEKGQREGVHDLCGNVWEWTASRYLPFEGYQPLKVDLGREEVEGLAGFDPNFRVVVGGSFQQDPLGVRIATRMGASRIQRTDSLGFRCAASTLPGKDAAVWVIEEDLSARALPEGTELFPNETAGLQHWQHEEGTAEVEDYAVITDYQRVFFCPVRSVPASNEQELARQTAEEPVLLGLVSFEHPLLEPEIDGGSYLVHWRGAGRLRLPESEEDEAPGEEAPPVEAAAVPATEPEEVRFWEVRGFDEDDDVFLLYDLEGSPLVAFPAPRLEFRRKKGPGTVALEPFVPPEEPPAEGAPPVVPKDTLRFSLAIDGKSPSRALHVDLPLALAPGTIDENWR